MGAYLNSGTRANSSGATSRTPALPGSRVSGNLLLAIIGSKNNFTHTSSSPGWSKLDQRDSGTGWTTSLWIYNRTGGGVDGSEAAPTVDVASSNVACFGQVIQCSGPFDPDDPIGATNFNTGTSSTHSCTGVNTTADNSLMLYIDTAAANTALATPSGWTENLDNGSSTGATRNTVGTKQMGSSGSASGDISVAGASAAWVMWQIELLDAPPHPWVKGKIEVDASQADYTFASRTPDMSKAQLVKVSWFGTVTAPTVAGCGLTWSQIASINAFDYGEAWFKGTGTSEAGVVTISFGGGNPSRCAAVALEIPDVDPADPVVQSKTGSTESGELILTLDAAPDAGNYVLGGFCCKWPLTPGSGFTQVAAPAAGTSWDQIKTLVEVSTGDQTINATFDFSGCVGVGLELRAASGAIEGSLNATLGALTAEASGTSSISGSVSTTLGSLVLAAAGTLLIEASLAATLAAASLSAAGSLPVDGSLDATLGELTLSATGEVGSGTTGSLDATLGALTLAGDGIVQVNGSLDTTLGSVAINANGVSTVHGDLSGTLGACSVTAEGGSTVTGELTSTLGSLALSAAGTLPVTGSLDATLGALLGSGAGVPEVPGEGAGVLAPLTIAATGSVEVHGSLGTTLAPLTGSGEATTVVTGSAAVTLGALTCSAAGTLPLDGSADVMLDPLTLHAEGQASNIITGSLNVTLGALTCSAQGSVEVQGSVVATLGALTSVAHGASTVTGSVDATLGTLTCTAAGVSPVTGEAAAQLGQLQAYALGTSVVQGDCDRTLDALTLTGVIVLGGMETIPGLDCQVSPIRRRTIIHRDDRDTVIARRWHRAAVHTLRNDTVVRPHIHKVET